MFRRRQAESEVVGERLPVYRRAECLGETCMYYSGVRCESRLELLEALGESGGKDKAPLLEDCSYALYGQVCMGGDEQVVVGLHTDSPNGKAGAMELIGRSGRYEQQRIVLTTPPDAIVY